MEVLKWESSMGEESGDESHEQYTNDDDKECSYAPGLGSKLQPRNIVSKARWNPEMEMAEVMIQKGSLWKTTGMARNGTIYCLIEEVLYLAEVGALLLLDDCDADISLGDIYIKLANGKSGCCWEQFQAYRQLKSLGYIVGRHGVPWSLKVANRSNECVSSKCSSRESGLIDLESEDERSIIGMFNGIQINEAMPVFDVYLPNNQFRKSSPGDPNFILCFTRGFPPSKAELEALERQCGGVPLKFCQVEHGRVNFFSFDRVELPVLI